MAADESDKRKGLVSGGGIIKPHKSPLSASESTGDPLRDAIISQGKTEQALRDALYEHAWSQESEALKETKRALDAWSQSPTEDVFNREWFTPNDVLDVSDVRLADDAEKWSIVQQLQAGTIRAVARKAQVDPHILATEHLAAIFPDAWRRMDLNAESYFWKTSNLVVPTGRPTGDKERYFDIRFDPASFSGKPILPPPPRPSQGNATSAMERDKDLSVDEANRFSRAILAGWPDATEKFAHTKALAFFPANRVPREWFLGIFRSIRGHKNRGKQPKIRE